MDQNRYRALEAYKATNVRAASNTVLQSLSGIAGFPWNLGVDAAVVPTIYVPLWNKIRAIYGYPPVQSQDSKIVLKILPEVFIDLAVDKALGSIPIAGAYFNAICAKTLTWRLGILFTFLSSRGSDVDNDVVSQAMKLIRELFPQTTMWKFETPSKDLFLSIACSVYGISQADFKSRIETALGNLRGDN